MTHPPKTEQDFVSVPRVPTEAMKVAGLQELPWGHNSPETARRCWSAMLAAAAPAQVSAEGAKPSLAQMLHEMTAAEHRREADVLDRIRVQVGREDEEAWNALVSSAHWMRVEANRRAALSHPASPVTDPFAGVEVEPHLLEPVGPSIPAGMKPWTGGDGAPEDWDGGMLLLRNGEWDNGQAGNDWRHTDPAAEDSDSDIIAYTPRHSLARAQQQGERG